MRRWRQTFIYSPMIIAIFLTCAFIMPRQGYQGAKNRPPHIGGPLVMPPLANTSLAIPLMPTDAYDIQTPFPSGLERAVAPPPTKPVFDLPAFNHLVGFKTALLLPHVTMIGFFQPEQMPMRPTTKIAHEDYFLPEFGSYSLQTIMPITRFTNPLGTRLYRRLTIQTLCDCFADGTPSPFYGSGVINIDFTAQTAHIGEIDLQDKNQHSLRGRMEFRINNQINSFTDDNAQLLLRLDNQAAQRWDAAVIGAFQTPAASVIHGHFAAQSAANEASLIGRFTPK